MARGRDPRDTDAPDEVDDDETPRPVDLPHLAWKNARRAKITAREAADATRHLESRVQAIEVHFFGIEGQPATGALARSEAALGEIRHHVEGSVRGLDTKLGELAGKLEHVRFLQWKIVTAAALGGTFGALVIQGALWVAGHH
jgi:hypothetical protein